LLDQQIEEQPPIAPTFAPIEVIMNKVSQANSLSQPPDSLLPEAYVKRTIRLNGEVKNVSSEAVMAVNKATEQFVAHLSRNVLEKVRKDQRSQITFEDINSLVSETSTYEFLRPAKGYLNSSYVL
jgi:histone H3/H4